VRQQALGSGRGMKINKDDITGLMGGIKPRLELTQQEFKMLNQAVNPACIENEEAIFSVKFIQSIKTRYDTIKEAT
jgi:hypothetical protein